MNNKNYIETLKVKDLDVKAGFDETTNGYFFEFKNKNGDTKVVYCGSKNPTSALENCPKIPMNITNVTIYVPGIRRSITPIKIRKIAPIIIAITDVSPIVPGILPISISMELLSAIEPSLI